MARQYKALGEDIWKNRVETINAELFIFTYGSLVVQLVKDYEDYDQVNTQLEKMGYSIGVRLIEDFLARSGWGRCTDFKETMEVISKIGFKMFLNITPTITNWSSDNRTCSLILDENPLNDFVELPADAQSKLWYSNVFCGVLRGALEMVQMQIEATFVSDVLRGDDASEIRLQFVRFLQEEMPNADE
ncbi:transport protein particle 22 kDa subunit [Tieghemiomyces parasiticus]|uniref:Trafficking protein particle complex subunit BET3 n=1 Tax=Tieghemiomyces parasiticus TaxID=78921 RepID=A0A9W7ZI15_9FUNG|nr:transport protein particle 22 kDa subunit [Tieghemiomyces parasiticus]KAJ1922803.1 transport protein particle 22 kDa subunit [Tieghemiomyces parasiticus]